ncbi:hypothetical protein ACFL59_01040 [Planctomycetota bacterium]
MSGSNVKRAPGEAPLRDVAPAKGGRLYPAISKGKLALIRALFGEKPKKMIKAVSWGEKIAFDQDEVELIAIMEADVKAGTEVTFSISKLGEEKVIEEVSGKVADGRAAAKWTCDAPEPEEEEGEEKKEEKQGEKEETDEDDDEEGGQLDLTVLEMPAYVFVAKCEEEEARSKCLLTVPLPPSPTSVGDAVPPPPESDSEPLSPPPSAGEGMIPPPPRTCDGTIPPPPNTSDATLPPPPNTCDAAIPPPPSAEGDVVMSPPPAPGAATIPPPPSQTDTDDSAIPSPPAIGRATIPSSRFNELLSCPS